MKVIYYPRCSCGWRGEGWSDKNPQSWLSFVRVFQILRPGTIDNFKGVHLSPTVREYLDTFKKEHYGPDHNVSIIANVTLTDEDVLMLGGKGNVQGY